MPEYAEACADTYPEIILSCSCSTSLQCFGLQTSSLYMTLAHDNSILGQRCALAVKILLLGVSLQPAAVRRNIFQLLHSGSSHFRRRRWSS